MTDHELSKLADDGCPHVGEKVEDLQKVYMLFVPYRPHTLRAMIGHKYAVDIDPMTHGGKVGSVVASACADDINALYARFYLTETVDAEAKP